MGLFDKFKKKETAKEYNLLSGQGLIDFVNDKLENPTGENVLKAVQAIARPDADQEHLTKEGELPWGWHSLNKEFTDKIQSEYSYFSNEWINARNLAPLKQYSALKSFVLYLKDTQKLCYSKNECFAYWFDRILTSPGFVEKRIAELEELESNLNKLQGLYEHKQKELHHLDKRVMQVLKQNDGILQADFLKMFDESVKNEVSEMLYIWGKDGKIERTKTGRSYTLHVK